ncbi:MAG: peptidylprolyl isomerase [Thermaurantimonas sp.]
MRKTNRPEVIQDDTIVEISYELREGGPQGPLLEIMSENWPLKFYFGAGTMLSGFENCLRGLREGDRFSFTLPAEEAYGQIRSDLIKEINLSELPDSEYFPNRVFEIGDYVHFQFGTSDQPLTGVVTVVLPNSIVVDFNHSMAGRDLHFTGRVLFIRTPTADEAVQKRYIEPNGVRSNSRLTDGSDLYLFD